MVTYVLTPISFLQQIYIYWKFENVHWPSEDPIQRCSYSFQFTFMMHNLLILLIRHAWDEKGERKREGERRPGQRILFFSAHCRLDVLCVPLFRIYDMTGGGGEVGGAFLGASTIVSRCSKGARGRIIWMTTICRRCGNGNAAYVRSEFFWVWPTSLSLSFCIFLYRIFANERVQSLGFVCKRMYFHVECWKTFLYFLMNLINRSFV